MTPPSPFPDIQTELSAAVGAEQIRFDRMTRLLYSTDASHYQIVPVGVTFPRHAEDVQAIHEIAHRHRIPILPRGSGTSLAGQTVGHALVMDFTRHMRRVRAIQAETATVTVEPGLVLDHLNRQLRPLRLMYGPDPASSSRATMGGIIGNNSTGSHSIVYGMTSDNVARLEVVLASGERVWLDSAHPTLENLRRIVGQLAHTHAETIRARWPRTWRTVAGYALNQIDPAAVDLTRLLVGSEGTLATVVQAELRLVPLPLMKRLVILHFDTLRASLEATPAILETSPAAVELLDRFLLNKTRENAEFSPKLTFITGDPAAVLIVEYTGESEAALDDAVQRLQTRLRADGFRGDMPEAATPQAQNNVWEIRKAGLNLMTSERGDIKPMELIEDVAVPVEYLADYIDDVAAVIAQAGTDFGIYAHASAGCLHVRPLLTLKTARGLEQYRYIAEATADLVLKYHGTLTGEHGDGILRSEFSPRIFGAELTGAFEAVKAAFDPHHLMNPGKIVFPEQMDNPAIFRHSPLTEVIPVQTRFDWSSDFGFMGAIEMCNGSGVCRKEGTGTMCPSFMATRDEAHATRGRANALRVAMTGHLGEIGLASDEVKSVFDLCLSCKACQAECPSSVDVARMKSEFLATYHDAHGTPLSTRLFASVHHLNALGSRFPALTNAVFRSPLPSLALRALGINTRRKLPMLARRRFSADAPPPPSVPDALLFVDTFTEYNHPEIGAALMRVAGILGLRIQAVRLPANGCCQRPAISKGLLDVAKAEAEKNIRSLRDQYPDLPLLFLEPSCQSAFEDDYRTLVSSGLQEDAKALAGRCISAETWLLEHLSNRALNWDRQPRQILLHGHCHQKALWGTSAAVHLLMQIPGASVSEIDSGCCGMAGSFGYEHEEVSWKIAGDRLLPAVVAQPEAIIAAPGTSCRAQLHDAGHGGRVRHPIEVIAEALLP